MDTARRRPSWRLVVTTAAACLLTVGCTQSVAGTAVRNPRAVPLNVPMLSEADLDAVMLTFGELESAAGAPNLETISDTNDMSDNVDAVSAPDCLGSVMGAEDSVYSAVDWTAVRDHVVGDERGQHWVEQTAVLYASEADARAFYDESARTWADCSKFSVTVDDVVSSYIWEIGAVDVRDDMITQVTFEQDDDDWQCQHAMSQASNLIVETMSCTFGPSEGAVRMARRMLAKAANV